MYKAFLIFKSNLELGLSIILKERELYNQNMLSWSVNTAIIIFKIIFCS